MIIKVWLISNSQPKEFTEINNVYVKGALFCIFEKGSNRVTKYPIGKILRVQVLEAVENYKKIHDMDVKIALETTQEPITRDHVNDTYTKNGFYCVEHPVDIKHDPELFSSVIVEMYPLDIISEVIESYF